MCNTTTATKMLKQFISDLETKNVVKKFLKGSNSLSHDQFYPV